MLNETQFGGSEGNEYTAPNGKTYTMKHETGNMTAALTPRGKTAGRIATFGFGMGGGEPEEQTIHQISVSGPHKGKGVATALMDYQRKQQPDLHHSSALTPDGEKFAAATPRAWQPKLDPDPQYTGSINDSNPMGWKEIRRKDIGLKNERNQAYRRFEKMAKPAEPDKSEQGKLF